MVITKPGSARKRVTAKQLNVGVFFFMYKYSGGAPCIQLNRSVERLSVHNSSKGKILAK
jgi:hypothetical protein